MKTIKKFSIILLNICLLANFIYSEIEPTGSDFLKIGVGARYTGMGETGIASVNDNESLNINISGLAELKSIQIYLEHGELYSEIENSLRYESFNLGLPLNTLLNTGNYGVIGVKLFYLYLPEFDSYDEWGEIIDSAKYYGLKTSLGYSRIINVSKEFNVDAGIMLNYISQKFDDINSPLNFTIDLGIQSSINQPINSLINILGKEIKLGLILGNIYLQSIDEDKPAPVNLGFGVGLPIFNNGIFEINGVNYFTGNFDVKIGAEYNIYNIITLRAGLKLSDNNTIFSGGAGSGISVAGKKLKIDYSIVSANILGLAHRFSLKVDF